MIETKTRTVFLSTLKGRHYLTKSGAVKAEARALIEAKHPTERPDFAAEHQHKLKQQQVKTPNAKVSGGGTFPPSA